MAGLDLATAREHNILECYSTKGRWLWMKADRLLEYRAQKRKVS